MGEKNKVYFHRIQCKSTNYLISTYTLEPITTPERKQERIMHEISKPCTYLCHPAELRVKQEYIKICNNQTMSTMV